jgi:2-polyprenyl-6-methoxyphenol hydroxylase-like FAD-dependent oxidoreductase/catechol 2,3-dioxygenase-like lactoylglutathione lyase family enzyme
MISDQEPTKQNLYTEGTTSEILSALPTLFPSAACPSLLDSKICVIGGSIGGLCVAASLIQSGFSKENVTVLEKSLQAQPGAGIGLDDASLAILKGLGLPLLCHNNDDDDERKAKKNNGSETATRPVAPVAVQRMRYIEDRLANGQVLTRQPYPYLAVRYAELVRGLENLPALADGVLVRGQKAVRIEQLQLEESSSSEQPNHKQRSCRVHFEDSTVAPIDCDLVICADGSRSVFRSLVRGGTGTDGQDGGDDDDDDDLRFAGYTAWRGTIHESKLPKLVLESLKREFSHYSNCLYFVHEMNMDASEYEAGNKNKNGRARQSAVLYDIGDGLVNWLVYDPVDQPKAPPGRTTTTATPQDIELLHKEAKTRWGEGLGGVIECTLDPYQNDIYDIRFPLTSFVNQPENNVCVLGDAAHPITPHFAKGSNLAIHDALVLAKCARNALTIPEWMAEYSDTRVNECRRTVLLSRHLGRVRNGMPLLVESNSNGNQLTRVLEQTSNIISPLPTSGQVLEAQILEAGIPTSALPLGRDFMPAWDFLQRQLPLHQRGIFLRDDIHVAPPLSLVAANHISRGTSNVERLVHFYQKILGFCLLDDRPDFGFGGAWLQLPGGMPFHIIESDAQKPKPASSSCSNINIIMAGNADDGIIMPPERYIRRSEHIAFTVNDIDQAKEQLKAHSIPFAVNYVPGTNITQLFLYDPDGNGVEIGDFNNVEK